MPLVMFRDVLLHHHIPPEIIEIIKHLYTNFFTCVSTSAYTTEFIHFGRGVLQGDCISPLLFNLIINTFIQHIKQKEYEQLGYKFSKYFSPRHWYQFADDASVITGQEYEAQILLNAFTRWCTWSDMIIRVDKCKTFGLTKRGSNAVQTQPKLFVNNEYIPLVPRDEDFEYLGRFFNYAMDNKSHKQILLDNTEEMMKTIDKLPLHPKYKILIYSRYVLSKLSWHLTVAGLPKTWVENNLDNLCCGYLRCWLEMPISGTLDIISLPRSKFGLNIIPISTKFIQCQLTMRNCINNSSNEDLKFIHQETSQGKNVQYDMFKSTREVLKVMRKEKEEHIATLSSQNLVINSIWNFVMVSTKAHWFSALDSLPKIYIYIRYMNNTLATNKNLLLWKKKHTSQCFACGNEQTLGHVAGGCNSHLREERFNWRHNSILVNLANSLKVYSDVQLYVDNDKFQSPSIITGDDQIPDLLLIDKRTICMYLN